MKQKDIALILVVAFVGAVAALLISNWLITGQQNREQTAEVIDVVTDEFQQPPEDYFNADSINPTKLIKIGGESNPNPFGSGGQ